MTSWSCTMHIVCLTSLALGVMGPQPQKGGDLRSEQVLESIVCSKQEVEDGQCHRQVPKDSHPDELNVVGIYHFSFGGVYL